MTFIKTIWTDEEQTRAFAQAMALNVQKSPADSMVITLHGDLGSGKTTLVRYFLQALGVTDRIKSPTYGLVEMYLLQEPQALTVWHFDFYRLHDPQEWEDAGFRDIFAAPGFKLVEWPNKAQGQMPQADLAIYFEVSASQHRHITLQTHSAAGAALIA